MKCNTRTSELFVEGKHEQSKPHFVTKPHHVKNVAMSCMSLEAEGKWYDKWKGALYSLNNYVINHLQIA